MTADRIHTDDPRGDTADVLPSATRRPCVATLTTTESDFAVRPRVVVVLGMHRGGTSAITRAVIELGADVGSDLMPGVAGVNPDGFWENVGVYRLNEELLRRLGRDWHTVGPVERSQWLQPAVQSLRADAGRFVAATFGKSPIWAFKDPRTARLLPFWQAVLRDVGMAPSYVIAVRNPWSVAASLGQRDAMSGEHALLLWLEHMVESVVGTEGEPRCFVDYDRLVDHPEEEISRIDRELCLTNAPPPSRHAAFIRPTLRHWRQDAAAATFPLVRDAYEALEALSSRRVAADELIPPDLFLRASAMLADLAPILSALDSQRREIASQAERIGALERSALAAANENGAKVQALEAALHAVADVVATAHADQSDAEDRLSTAEAELARLRATRSWRLTLPARELQRFLTTVLGVGQRPKRSGHDEATHDPGAAPSPRGVGEKPAPLLPIQSD